MKNFLNIVNKNKLFIFIVSAFIVVVATFIPTYYNVSSFAGGSNISSTPVNLGILYFTNDLSFFGIFSTIACLLPVALTIFYFVTKKIHPKIISFAYLLPFIASLIVVIYYSSARSNISSSDVTHSINLSVGFFAYLLIFIVNSVCFIASKK